MYRMRVSSNGQITIPQEMRRKLGIKAGDRMIVVLDDEQIRLKPFTKTLLDLRGSVKVKGGQHIENIKFNPRDGLIIKL